MQSFSREETFFGPGQTFGFDNMLVFVMNPSHIGRMPKSFSTDITDSHVQHPMAMRLCADFERIPVPVSPIPCQGEISLQKTARMHFSNNVDSQATILHPSA